jgi:long-subunit acyl-CoA synthetase (AMP-forming)
MNGEIRMLNTVNEFVKEMQSKENPTAVNYLDKGGRWHSLSTSEVLRQVKSLCIALKVLGLKPGNKIALMAPPSYLWPICDLAILLGGFVTVPLFHNISEDNFVIEVTQSEAKIIFVMGDCGHRCVKNI